MTAPIRATGIRIARLDADGSPAGPWRTVGATAMTLVPAIEDATEAFAAMHRLEDATLTIAFQPSRALRRLVLGPRWAWDRRRRMAVTRRKYRARARRGRA